MSLILLTALSGCGNLGDSPLYRTPLPNGFEQWSNGYDFGMIVRPRGKSGDVIAPLGDGPHGRDRYCNEFGWAGDLVVGTLIEYADKAFVDPPLSKEYLLFDTASGDVVYFKTRAEVVDAWKAKTSAALPTLTARHHNTVVSDP